MDGLVLPTVVRLGIPGLASLTDSMMSGSLYALVAEAPPARYSLLASSLSSALKQGLTCTVILPGNPADFIERVGRFGQFDMHKAIAEGHIQIFTEQDNFSKNMFRYGTETFCRELGHFNIPPDSFLVFDQADDLLSLHDVSLALSQVSALRQWFGSQNITAVLSFLRIASSASALAALQCLMDQLGGIARLGGHRDGLEIVFDYWSSPEGTVAAKIYPLHTAENGMLAVLAPSPISTPGLRNGQPDWPEDREKYFFFMDPDLISLGKQMPGVWQHVDTLVGMMHATRETHSSTVILTYRRDTEIRQMAQTVHTLRHALGPRAHLVVQEKGASLRYQNEALLLRLGLNLVIHVDVPVSRLPLLLASLKGQIFDRDIDINFEMALASVSPSGLKGYVLPARFVAEVSALLERAETLDIPCALVLGIPARDVTAANLLAQMLMSRTGDLVSFDQQNCYLFLNSCPEASLLMTLERVLGQGVGAAFVESRFVVRRHEILAELAALTRAAERFSLPDYSTLPMRSSPAYSVPPSATSFIAPVVFASQPVITASPTTLSVTEPVSAPVTAPVAAAPTLPEAMPQIAPLHEAMPAMHEAMPEPMHEPMPEPMQEPQHESLQNAPLFKPRKPFAGHGIESVIEELVLEVTGSSLEPSYLTAPHGPQFDDDEPVPQAASGLEFHAQSESTPDVAVPAQSASFSEPPAQTTSGAGSGQFHYDGELGKVMVFGKREAPRATRAVKKA